MTKNTQGNNAGNDAPQAERVNRGNLAVDTSSRESEQPINLPDSVSTSSVARVPSVPGAGEFEPTDDGIDDGGWLCI